MLLVNGFKKGFSLKYRGSYSRCDESNNIPISVGSPQEIWAKLMTEVELKGVSGPYDKDEFPLDEFVQSQIGLVPKSGGKTR